MNPILPQILLLRMLQPLFRHPLLQSSHPRLRRGPVDRALQKPLKARDPLQAVSGPPAPGPTPRSSVHNKTAQFDNTGHDKKGSIRSLKRTTPTQAFFFWFFFIWPGRADSGSIDSDSGPNSHCGKSPESPKSVLFSRVLPAPFPEIRGPALSVSENTRIFI